MADEFQRRLPSSYRRIADIRPEDIRVCIIGRIVDSYGTTVVIDDGTGKITATCPYIPETDSTVRVLGRVIETEAGPEIQADVIQKIENIDIELYRKIEEAWEK